MGCTWIRGICSHVSLQKAGRPSCFAEVVTCPTGAFVSVFVSVNLLACFMSALGLDTYSIGAETVLLFINTDAGEQGWGC